jgi:hypothetical protein
MIRRPALDPNVLQAFVAVAEIPAATSEEIRTYYAHRLSRETDCHDVYESMKAGRAPL